MFVETKYLVRSGQQHQWPRSGFIQGMVGQKPRALQYRWEKWINRRKCIQLERDAEKPIETQQLAGP